MNQSGGQDKKTAQDAVFPELLCLDPPYQAKVASHKLHALADLYSRNTAARLKATFAFLCFLFIKYIICGPLLGSMQLFFFFSCLADLLILLYVITKACSREQIIKGLREISNGNLQYKIPLERLWGDDKHIAEYINNIGSGLDAAVENSVKNERMKTELITNVSHVSEDQCS